MRVGGAPGGTRQGPVQLARQASGRLAWPNFGCCTANFNQGWPKLANNIVLQTPSGYAIAVLAPSVAKLADGGNIEVVTDYPFGDSVTINTDLKTAAAVEVRIPGWAAAKATVDGKPVACAGRGADQSDNPCSRPSR